MMNTTTTLDHGMFNLPNVGLRLLFDARRAQESATLLVQWCLDEDAVAYLRQEQVTNSLIVLSTLSDNGREERQVIRLFSRDQAIVQFHRPGKHKVRARIVWSRNLSKLKKDTLEECSRGVYKHTWECIQKCEDGLGNAEFEVDVDARFFAPEMSPRLTWWVNLWHTNKAWDECDLRRRKAFAFTVQPLLVAPWLIGLIAWRLCVAFFLSCLVLQRNVSWDPVLHPFTCATREIWMNRTSKDSGWCAKIQYDSKGNERDNKWAFLFFLFPLPHFLVFTICMGFWIIGYLLGRTDISTIWRPLAVCFSIFAAMVTVILAVFFLAWINPFGGIDCEWKKRLAERADSVMTALFTWLEKGMDEREVLKAEQTYKALACERAPVSGLRPMSSLSGGFIRTPRLMYQNIKAKVCRPVARG